MRLFLYYGFCSVKNQLRKLFKTWVLISFLCFFCFSLLFGIISGVLAGGSDNPPDDEITETPSDDDVTESPSEDGGGLIDKVQREDIIKYADVGVSALALVIFLYSVLGADKQGAQIFLVADCNLLFSAPMKPQSVLLFKLMTKIFLSVASVFYLLIQIPVLLSKGIKIYEITLGYIVIIALFIAGKLLNVLIFTLTNTYTRYKKFIRPTALSILGVIVLSFGYFYLKSDNLLYSLERVLTPKWTRFIPVFGWVKASVVYLVEGKIIVSLIFLLLLLFAMIISCVLIWRIKADFYEDALSNSQQLQDALDAAQNGTIAVREKARSEKILRNKFERGSGADVFLFKSLYNRKRFAVLGLFSKTNIFYMICAVAAACYVRFVLDVRVYTGIGIALCIIAFLRSLANPITADVTKDYFITIPATAHSKVFWSLLAGSIDCVLDTLLPVLTVALIIGTNPLPLLSFWLVAVGIDFYASNCMMFIELSLPVSLSKQIKNTILMFFIYFGLSPVAIVVLLGFNLNMMVLFNIIAAFAAVGIGGILFAFSPLFLDRGRK